MRVEAGNGVKLDGAFEIVEPGRETPRVALLRHRPRGRVIIAKRISKVAGAAPKPLLNGRVGFFHLGFDLSAGKRPYIRVTRRMPLDAKAGGLERLELAPIHEPKRSGAGLLLGPATFPADPSTNHENMCGNPTLAQDRHGARIHRRDAVIEGERNAMRVRLAEKLIQAADGELGL